MALLATVAACKEIIEIAGKINDLDDLERSIENFEQRIEKLEHTIEEQKDKIEELEREVQIQNEEILKRELDIKLLIEENAKCIRGPRSPRSARRTDSGCNVN
jgi:predicted RNase H-like nuclease (RuvC/YqgF family)